MLCSACMCVRLDVIQVYRLHALLPDNITVRKADSGQQGPTVDLADTLFEAGTHVNTTLNQADLFTTLGMGGAGPWPHSPAGSGHCQ